MSTLFDTHAAVQKLKDAGFTEQQAEAQIQVFLDIAQSSRDIEALRLATKVDLAELKTDLIKWMIGTIGFMTTLFIFVVKFL
jgi:hypothetical protein